MKIGYFGTTGLRLDRGKGLYKADEETEAGYDHQRAKRHEIIEAATFLESHDSGSNFDLNHYFESEF